MLAVTGSFVCCSVVVLFACVVLLCVLFEPCVCVVYVVVVQVRQNNSVSGCNSVGVVVGKVIGLLWITYSLIIVLWIKWWISGK